MVRRDFKQRSNGLDYYFMKGWVYSLMKNSELSEVYLDSARVITESLVVSYPYVAESQSLMGQIFAILDRKDEAIAAAKRGVELLPVSVDALDGPDGLWSLARVYCEVGEFDSAIDELDSLLSIPSKNSVEWLRVAPEFRALRDLPRFQALLEKYDTESDTGR